MEEPQKKSSPNYRNLVILLILVAAIWATSGLMLYDEKERGTFGDMFGAINALFSGLAFASIIYTIYLQRHELTLQREELRLTREELHGQKLQLSAQNEVLRAQNFENTFFQLMRLLNDTVNGIDIRRSEANIIHGRDCFRFFYDMLKRAYNKTERENLNFSEEEKIFDSYQKFYQSYQSDIGHYFRALYNIFKFVNSSEIENKKFYTNLVRAQLSSHELLLLFYNCQTPLGIEKFRPLIEEYSLLKTIPKELVIKADHLSLYKEDAFK